MESRNAYPDRAEPALSRDLSQFQVFSLLYTTAIVIETFEDVPFLSTIHTHNLFYLIIATGFAHFVTKSTKVFFLLLSISTADLAFFKIPEVANHTNLLLFANITLILGLCHSRMVSGRLEDDQVWGKVAPVLGLLIIVTFVVAGFHKLNHDFLNPISSCIGWFGQGIARSLTADFIGMGVPAAGIFGLALAICGVLLLRERPLVLPTIDWRALVVPVVAVVVLGAVLAVTAGLQGFRGGRDAVVFLVAITVLCWQLVEGPMLLVKRFQWVALLFSLAVHASLAMFTVVDFQAIALALLATFTPPAAWAAWRERAWIRAGSLRIHRVTAFFALNLAAIVMVRVDELAWHMLKPTHVLPGVMFNLGLLVLVWPLVPEVLSGRRAWKWEGVAVFRRSTPWFLYLVPMALFLFGMTSHLGLRTAGNFSMFSNLKTEGETSNHLLFGSNPIKVWGYQEDVVEIVSIDVAAARIGHHYSDLNGMLLPIVEFRKLLYLWREAGKAFPITWRYGGREFSSENIALEPDWRVDRWDWEMKLLDFRPIQQTEPNRCRW